MQKNNYFFLYLIIDTTLPYTKLCKGKANWLHIVADSLFSLWHVQHFARAAVFQTKETSIRLCNTMDLLCLNKYMMCLVLRGTISYSSLDFLLFFVGITVEAGSTKSPLLRFYFILFSRDDSRDT
jgi:hypothetical protein